MCKRGKQWGVAVAAVAFVVGFLSTAREIEGQDAEIIQVFERGIACYQAGEYDKAKEAFDKVLAQEPGMPTALQMRDMSELGLFVEMKGDEQLGPGAEKLLDLMLRAKREHKRTIQEPGRLIGDFQSGEMLVYGGARVDLIGHGPYAVPCVVPLLALDGAEQQTVASRAISLLAGLQRDACLPLIQVLQGSDDSLVKRRVAGVLSQIGDARAVPALLDVCEDESALEPTRKAAAEALESITGQSPAELGSAAAQYADLGRAYFSEDAQRVGFTYGMSASIWQWDPGAGQLSEKVTYEQVPNYLYYQRMASDVALAGLASDPGSADLLSLLGASQVRQLVLCDFFKSEDARFAGKALDEEVRNDAADRVAELEVEAPVVLSMLSAPVVGRALEMTIEARDSLASLILVKALGQKLEAAGPAPPDADTTRSLVAALNCGDRDVRYNAAAILVRSCPTGECGPADQIMGVLSAALRAAADSNALVVMDSLQMRNKLVTVLRGEGVATTEARVDEGAIEAVLSLEPSVDIVFLSANVSDSVFAGVTELLQNDPRTKGAPLYAVVDPAEEGAKLTDYTRIEKVLSPNHLVSAVLKPVLEEKVFAQSRSAFTEQEEALVLKAARALSRVAPLNTQYGLQVLEPSLVKALTGYSEEVSAAVIASLAAFGSEAAVESLGRVVAGEASVQLKVAACGALAAVLKRVEVDPSEEVCGTLKNVLAGDVQELREAAAEVLSASGLSDEDMLMLLCTEGLGEG